MCKCVCKFPSCVCTSVSASSYTAGTHPYATSICYTRTKERNGRFSELSNLAGVYVWSRGFMWAFSRHWVSWPLVLHNLTFKAVEKKCPLSVNQPACGYLSKWPKGLRKLSGLSHSLVSSFQKESHEWETYSGFLKLYQVMRLVFTQLFDLEFQIQHVDLIAITRICWCLHSMLPNISHIHLSKMSPPPPSTPNLQPSWGE